MRRTLLAAVAIALVIGASGCGGSATSSSPTATAKRTLTDLHSIGQLRGAFNTASGEPRLIVLVSPT